MESLVIPWASPEKRRRKWLVGVSGGADSVTLLHILHDAGFEKLVVCHLHHGLRGRAASEDARFVTRLAGRLGYGMAAERVDVQARMKRCGESLETAARAERLAFFARVARRERCHHVLLGHHADDQAETVLWNLLRGSHGLRGMKQERVLMVEGKKLVLVRPLLHVRHRELTAWLKSRGLHWREDATNALPLAVRNRLRAEVIPLLEEISGRDPVSAICRLAQDFAEWEQCASEWIRDHKVMDPQGRIHLGALRQLPMAMQRRAVADFLRELQTGEINRALLDSILTMAKGEGSAVVNLPGGKRMRRTGGRLWLDA